MVTPIQEKDAELALVLAHGELLAPDLLLGAGRPVWPGGPADAPGWVIRFNALGIEALRDRPKSGPRGWLDARRGPAGELASLRALVLCGPDRERDGVSTWRAKDLCRIVEQRYGVTYSETACCACSTTSTSRGRRRARSAASAPSAPSIWATSVTS